MIKVWIFRHRSYESGKIGQKILAHAQIWGKNSGIQHSSRERWPAFRSWVQGKFLKTTNPTFYEEWPWDFADAWLDWWIKNKGVCVQRNTQPDKTIVDCNLGALFSLGDFIEHFITREIIHCRISFKGFILYPHHLQLTSCAPSCFTCLQFFSLSVFTSLLLVSSYFLPISSSLLSAVFFYQSAVVFSQSALLFSPCLHFSCVGWWIRTYQMGTFHSGPRTLDLSAMNESHCVVCVCVCLSYRGDRST